MDSRLDMVDIDKRIHRRFGGREGLVEYHCCEMSNTPARLGQRTWVIEGFKWKPFHNLLFPLFFSPTFLGLSASVAHIPTGVKVPVPSS
jgi:hypothetical protein